MKFWIENIPTNTTEREIRQLFSCYGNVQAVELMPGPVPGKHPGSGLIELAGINIKDVDSLPDRCLFKGAVVRIRRQQSTTDSPSTGSPAASPEPPPPSPLHPDKHSKTTFHVISVEEVVDPKTGESNGWCRYSIKSLAGSISGLRHGSVAEVTLHAEDAAAAFNLRNMRGCRRGPVWSPRQKK